MIRKTFQGFSAFVFFLAVAAGCDNDGGPLYTGTEADGGAPADGATELPAASEPQLDRYFAIEPPYQVSACDQIDTRLAGRREIRLFSNGSVDVAANTRALQRYYKRHGLAFFTNAAPKTIETSYALDTDLEALMRGLVAAFPNVDFNGPMPDMATFGSILKFTVNFLLRPMIDFARVHGNQGANTTNFVVLPQVVRPSAMKVIDGTLLGLAVSPALVEAFIRDSPQEGEIWKGADLPPGFTPMMFLDHHNLELVATRDPVLRDLVVAHEFGHTGALLHRMSIANLMNPGVIPGVSKCSSSIDDDQMATMQSTLGVGTTGKPLTIEGPSNPITAPRVEPAPRFWLPPERFSALLRGDGEAMRTLLAPILHLCH